MNSIIVEYEDTVCGPHGGEHKVKLVFLADMHVLPKGWHISTKVNGFVSQERVIFIFTACNADIHRSGKVECHKGNTKSKKK